MLQHIIQVISSRLQPGITPFLTVLCNLYTVDYSSCSDRHHSVYCTCSLQNLPVTLELQRNRSVKRQELDWSLSFYSCYTHLLISFISPSPSTLLLPLPLLYFHISLSSSVSPRRLIWPLWRGDCRDNRRAREISQRWHVEEIYIKIEAKVTDYLFWKPLKAPRHCILGMTIPCELFQLVSFFGLVCPTHHHLFVHLWSFFSVDSWRFSYIGFCLSQMNGLNE